MQAFVVIPTLAFLVLGLSASAYAQDGKRGLSTSAYPQNVERVRRELRLQGYDQIEFTRATPPFTVNACQGEWRLRMDVDNYGKVANRTLIGFCHGEGSQRPAAASPSVVTRGQTAETENSTISGARPKEEPKITNNVDCKRYLPATGMTLTVPCD